MITIDRKKIKELSDREEHRFQVDHPRSAGAYKMAQNSLLGGVPMNWMKKRAGAFPIFEKSAKGAHFTDTETASDIDAHTQIFASAVRELAG